MPQRILTLILGSPSQTAFTGDYFLVELNFNLTPLPQSVLIGLLQAFAFRTREFLLTVFFGAASNFMAHHLSFHQSEALAFSCCRHSGIVNVN